jgi:hypothetical protein
MIPEKTPFLLLFLSLCSGPLLWGQAAEGVRATTKVYPDGSTRAVVVDYENKTSEEVIKDASGKITRKNIFVMDDRNQVVGATHLDAKGKVLYRETFTLDASNRVVQSQLYSSTDQPLGRRVFTYGAKGAPRVEDYDEKGNLIKTTGGTRSGRANPPATRNGTVPAR